MNARQRLMSIALTIPDTAALLEAVTMLGEASPGRSSHSDTTLYISLMVLHTKYTGLRENDFNAYA